MSLVLVGRGVMEQIEVVKGTIPKPLLDRIQSCPCGFDLELTCGELVSHVTTNVVCSQVVQQLADPKTPFGKDSEKALRLKNEGNAAFGASSFQKALELYTQGLRYAPFYVPDVVLLATLYVNRATALHALKHFMAAERDCTRAIGLQPEYAKAWLRRGQALAGLKVWSTAADDLLEALRLQTSASGRNQVSRELDRIKALENADRDGTEVEDMDYGAGPEPWTPGEVWPEDGVSPSWDPENQWGMHARKAIEDGMQIHEEEPVAAVILEEYRDTRCHYCFEPLRVDPVPCLGCAMPMYCDEPCLSAACDKNGSQFGEHMHECGGGTWSAVLPTDVVLAARLFARSQCKAKLGKKLYELCHHYNDMHAFKVDMLVMATVVALCMRNAVNNFKQTSGNIAKLVRLLAIVRANGMAITAVHLPPAEPSYPSTEDLKVSIAQGVYALGSKFNHSCKPNIHASFRFRRLKAYTIVAVKAGTQLKLSYGAAQVGEMRREERQAFLQERYFFTCACPSCKKVSQPELLFAFRCTRPGCNGVVPGPGFLQHPDQRSAMDMDTSERNVPKPGVCVSCGTALDLEYSTDAAKAVMEDLDRLRPTLRSLPTHSTFKLHEALNLLQRCQGIFHLSSKVMAKAEDVVAEAYCLSGQPKRALPHSKTSIQILENIYGKHHIAIAFERWKLFGIITDANGCRTEARSNMVLANEVLSIHYGCDWMESMEHLGGNIPHGRVSEDSDSGSRPIERFRVLAHLCAGDDFLNCAKSETETPCSGHDTCSCSRK